MSIFYKGGERLAPELINKTIEKFTNKLDVLFSSKAVITDAVLEDSGLIFYTNVKENIILLETVYTKVFDRFLNEDTTDLRKQGNSLPANISDIYFKDSSGVDIAGVTIDSIEDNLGNALDLGHITAEDGKRIFYYYEYILIHYTLPALDPNNLIELVNFKDSTGATVNLNNGNTIRVSWNRTGENKAVYSLLQGQDIYFNVTENIGDSFANNTQILIPTTSVDGKTPLNFLKLENFGKTNINTRCKLIVISNKSTEYISSYKGNIVIENYAISAIGTTGRYIHTLTFFTTQFTENSIFKFGDLGDLDTLFATILLPNSLNEFNLDLNVNGSLSKQLDDEPLTNIWLSNAIEIGQFKLYNYELTNNSAIAYGITKSGTTDTLFYSTILDARPDILNFNELLFVAPEDEFYVDNLDQPNKALALVLNTYITQSKRAGRSINDTIINNKIAWSLEFKN